GSELLKAVSDVLKFRGKKVYFSRYGYIAWITAYARSGGQPDKVKIGDPSGTKPRPDAKPKPGTDTPKTKPEPAAFGPTLRLPGATAWGTSAPAQIAVQVPESARVYFDDYLTKQGGVSRSYVTPPLPFGWEFRYQFTVEVVRDGKPVT